MSELNSEQVKANLLENAKQSIQLGVEDYTLAKYDHKRNISAVRNIFAGLLLLYKYKLMEISPKNNPYQYIQWGRKQRPDGLPEQTLNVRGILVKFKNFNILVNGKKIGEIQSFRNNIEHFYNVDDVDILPLIFHSFDLIENFYENYLICHEQKSLKEFLGWKTYKVLSECKSEFQRKLAECYYSFAEVDFPDDYLKDKFLNEMSCPYCNSNLIKYKSGDYPDLILNCASCSMGDNLDKEEVLGLTHHSIKDGGDFREECPECGEYTIFIDNICLECGFEKNPNIDYEREEYLQYLRDKDD